MKEKKLRRKIKTSKKGIALAAVALIMSGNLASISTPVLAETSSRLNQNVNIQENKSNTPYGEVISAFPGSSDCQEWNVSAGFIDMKESYGYIPYQPISGWEQTTLSQFNGVTPSGTQFGHNELLLPLYNNIPNSYSFDSYFYLGVPKYASNAASFKFQKSVNLIPNRTYKTTLSTISSSTNCSDQCTISFNGVSKSFTTHQLGITLTSKSDSNKGDFVFTIDQNTDGYVAFAPNLKVGLMYADEWESVDSLFTSTEHSELAPGVTSEKIQEVKQQVANVSGNQDATEMNAAISKAEQLWAQNEQAQIVQEATNEVNGLFNGENLADGVNQDKINEAQTAVDKVTDETKKQELQDKINKAQELLNQQNEQFTITSVDPYKEGVSQFVTGTYTGDNAAYVRLIVNGKKTALVPMKGLTEGTFKYYMDGLKATDKVSVVIYDNNYKQLAEKEVTINK